MRWLGVQVAAPALVEFGSVSLLLVVQQRYTAFDIYTSPCYTDIVVKELIIHKCNCCKDAERTWLCQPFGPDDAPTFVRPGWHYRGFVVIPVCDACKARMQRGEPVTATYKNRQYTVQMEKIA